MKQKGLPTTAMVGIVVAVIAVAGIAVVMLNPQTTTSTTPSTTTWTINPGEKIGFFEMVLDLEVPENGWGRVGMAYLMVPENEILYPPAPGYIPKTPTDLINNFFGSSQYDCLYLENFVENGKKKYLFRADSDSNSIRQDNIGKKFLFYLEWRVNYISEPVVFSMTVILPQYYEVDNVQCSGSNNVALPYVITLEDNRARIAVENARIEGSFERFILRIDYENTLL